jgi:uncharacterized phage protein (TIGR01671 family)
MTREIKFRAWSPNDKVMMLNDFHLNSSGQILAWESETNGYTKPSDVCILLQYTGLKDKNGKEIYEGDILRSKMGNRELIGVMRFDESRATFGFDSEIETDKELPEHLILHSKPEIIGNIYENPELLTLTKQEIAE